MKFRNKLLIISVYSLFYLNLSYGTEEVINRPILPVGLGEAAYQALTSMGITEKNHELLDKLSKEYPDEENRLIDIREKIVDILIQEDYSFDDLYLILDVLWRENYRTSIFVGKNSIYYFLLGNQESREIIYYQKLDPDIFSVDLFESAIATISFDGYITWAAPRRTYIFASIWEQQKKLHSWLIYEPVTVFTGIENDSLNIIKDTLGCYIVILDAVNHSKQGGFDITLTEKILSRYKKQDVPIPVQKIIPNE